MSHNTTLDRILSLPVADIQALQEGKTIAALPIVQIQKGWSFLLYPHDKGASSDDVKIEMWATCENSRMIHEVGELSTLSLLTPWSQSDLERILETRGHLSLALLKAYRLPESIEIPRALTSSIKFGKFVGLSQIGENFKSKIQVSEILPILSETVFAHRQKQMTNFLPPEHPELEKLQASIALYAEGIPSAQAFNNDLQCFLGWAEPTKSANIPEWVREITYYGNSKEGSLFEKRVREGLKFLGFSNTLNNRKVSLDPEADGGSGGLDFYCEKPYPIVGECKASQSEKVNDNKDGAPAQLIKLGQKLLCSSGYNSAIKIIIAPGELTPAAEETAIGNKMNIMRPETLQRLVELKVAHPGSIDLLELKPCLESAPFGVDADAGINQFMDRIEKRIEIRSHIVLRLKKFLQDKNAGDVKFDVYYGIFCGSNPPQDLTEHELHDILIELSSPLAGHLGRIKCSGSWKEAWRGDRFYYLRDLPAPKD
jgi:hypothetical protein